MALKAATTPLVISVTQGSADAFAQGSVLTGLSGRQAYNVRAILIEIPATVMSISADSSIEVAITRRSKTAMPTIADSDVLHKRIFAKDFATSGEGVAEMLSVYVPDLEVPIVEETLYAQVDSAATGLSNTVIVRLEVELDTMSDIDRLNLIARSLS